MKLIVHVGTGTVMDASECVMLDTDTDITEEHREMLDDYGWDDTKIIELASQFGAQFIGNIGFHRLVRV